jgi:hypothetical protein
MNGKTDKNGFIKCPCCSYYSIPKGEDGLFWICQVCYWENDLSEMCEEGYIGVNGISISDAIDNFNNYGVSNMKWIDKIDKNIRNLYHNGE